jgi:uncharacterized membrane protein required for colicin V production
MTLILPLLLFLLFVAIAATLYPEGMWGNAITLVNVVTAALLATNFWEPLAKLIEEYVPSFTFFWDYLTLWALFAVIYGIMRTVTDKLSRTKVRFVKVADQVGGAFFAAWVGWVVVCFAAMSLHTAPLSRNFMFGGFDPESRMMAGLAPDRQWLGFMQRMSRGPFSRTLGPSERDQNVYGRATNADEQGLAVFDRRAEFLPKYATRRAMLEDYVETKKAVRVPEGEYGSQVPKR